MYYSNITFKEISQTLTAQVSALGLPTIKLTFQMCKVFDKVVSSCLRVDYKVMNFLLVYREIIEEKLGELINLSSSYGA